jgi:predicted NBD/HSP70 family sugar kinase
LIPVRAADRGGLVPAAILGLLAGRGPASRAEIARALDVSSATITQMTKDLLARGLVEEVATGPSHGGRPGRLLGLVHSAGTALGVKITADHLAVVRVNLDLAIVESKRFPFDASRPDALDVIGRLLQDETADRTDLLGVGIGVPGAIDSQDSGVVDAPTLGWTDAQLGPQLRSRLGVPVLIDNDVNTLAVADRLFGVGRDHRNYLVVTIGRGIGLAMITDGIVYRGAAGGAGEIGHLCVDPDGPLCSCGLHGCLEAFIGDQALLASAGRAGHALQTPEDLRLAAAAGADWALQIYATAADLLGRSLAGLVHVFNPEVLVVLGEGVAAWPFWQPQFEISFRRHLMPARRSVPYLTEDWDEDTWALGAASLILASPFDATGALGAQGQLVRERLHANVARAVIA